MKTIVKFYGMRHGEKYGDMLTLKGEEQVILSARANLMDVPFKLAFFSGMKRALRTAHLALAAIGQANVDIREEPGFGYIWLYEDPNIPKLDAPPSYSLIGDYFVNGHAPTFGMRGRVMQTLIERAQDLALGHDGETVNVLVASHSPTIETAVPDPRQFPRLQEADIVRYTVKVEDGLARITDATFLSARPDEMP